MSADIRSAHRGTSGAVPQTLRRTLYIGVWLWMVVSYIRPQSIVPPLAVLPLGAVAALLVLFNVVKGKDYRALKEPLTKYHLTILAIICLGYFKAVNTYWLFQAFVEMLSYLFVFYLALPLIMEAEIYRLKFIKLLFVSYAVIGCWVITHEGHGQGAFLGDENDAALALSVGFGLCYPLLRVLPSRAWRIFGYISLALCVVGCLVSESRGGFLALLGVLAAITIFSGKFFKTLAGVLIAGLLVIPFIPESYVKEMNTMTDPRDSTRVQRLYMWRIGTQEYLSNPILGVGAQNFMYRVADYEVTPFVQKANIFNRSFGGRSVHSSYFQILPELGTGGAIVFLIMAVRVLRRGFTEGLAKDGRDATTVAIARGTAAGLIPFLIAGAFVSAAYYPHFWMLCGLSASLSLKPTTK